MRKKIIVAIGLLLLISANPFCTEVFASTRNQEIIITPYYSYITSVGASISIGKNGYATCTGSVTIFSGHDTSITITLQRSKDGKSWTNIKSWSKDFSGIGAHSLEDGYYVNSGYQYRVLNTTKVKNGSTVLETATVYSAVVSY